MPMHSIDAVSGQRVSIRVMTIDDIPAIHHLGGRRGKGKPADMSATRTEPGAT